MSQRFTTDGKAIVGRSPQPSVKVHRVPFDEDATKASLDRYFAGRRQRKVPLTGDAAMKVAGRSPVRRVLP